MTPGGNDFDMDRLGGEAQPSLVAELVAFLRHNKKWWLVPILLMFGIFGVLAMLASSSVAPFIYNLF